MADIVTWLCWSVPNVADWQMDLNHFARRTTADQEVLALITPLAKLGRFEAAADFFPKLCITISLPSGAIRANTSWLAIVILAFWVVIFSRPR